MDALALAKPPYANNPSTMTDGSASLKDLNIVIARSNTHTTLLNDLAGGAFPFAQHITDTTDSTSTTTGSLITDGGAGIAKALFVGGAFHATATTDSTSETTGSVIVTGGVGVAKKLFVKDTITTQSSFTAGTIISNAAGAVGAPSYTFTGQTDLGIYKASATQGAFSSGGVLKGGWDANGLYTGQITEQVGGVGVKIDHIESTMTLVDATTRSYNSVSTTSIATATNLSTATVHQTMTGASAVNSVEVAQFIATSAVEMGAWCNAVLAKVDLTTTGYVAGLVGVVCAELDMPSTAPAGGAGTYSVFEAEINMGSVAGVPVIVNEVNVWGAHPTEFDTNGYLFDINGVTKGSGKFFQDNTATAASQALKIRVNGTPYYIMLTSTGA